MGPTSIRGLCLAMVMAHGHCAPVVQQQARVTMFSGAGYTQSSYAALHAAVAAVSSGDEELCLAHSHDGAATALAAASASREASRCRAGLVLLGSSPSTQAIHAVPRDTRILLVGGDLDGVARLSRFALLRKQLQGSSRLVSFAVLRGASHHSFASGAPSALVLRADLKSALESAEAHAAVAAIVRDFLHRKRGAAAAAPSNGTQDTLMKAEHLAAAIAGPVIDALELEGSSAMGHPACNSDHPTNPTCGYTSWPAHSLPPGPHPAPSPPLPADCVCGSPWVENVATSMVAGLELLPFRPMPTLSSKDAFQDVSDTHPFHLPHIFNECTGIPCNLSAVTVTMPILKAGSLFPNASGADPPLSAFELRTKLKSRTAVWEAIGISAKDTKGIDDNNTICKAINERAYAWALAHAEPTIRARFLAAGEPMVMVDDKPAKIGITGPQWIQDELVYTRVGDAGLSTSRIEIQSWQFVVSNIAKGDVPWFFPVGMHYCKLLSPARAMEWIYTDGLRARTGY